MPPVEVYILGQKYTIKGDASEMFVKELAADIDMMLQQVLSKYPNITPSKAMVLTMFNMAAELHEMRSEQETISKHIRERTAILADLVD